MNSADTASLAPLSLPRVSVSSWAMRDLDRQRGWGMIELIIALVLGLLIALIASGLLLAATSNYRSHSESAWLDDSGRYALEIIAQAVRQGAYANLDSDGAPAALDAGASAGVAGLDASSISHSGEGIDTPLPPVANGSDVLALRFAGSGGGSGGDGSSVNCAGFGVAAPVTADDRGWSIFYVALDAQGEAELRCKYRSGGGWGSDAIVRGVDSFQVLYGLDTDTPPDGVPNTYLNASAINGLDATLALVGATPDELQRDKNRKTYWKRVSSIKLALLLHGDAASRPDSTATQFDLFGQAYADAHGGDDQGVRVVERSLPVPMQQRARHIFSATIALRNRDG